MKIKFLSFLIFLSFPLWGQEEISPVPEKSDEALSLELEKEEKNFQFLEKTEVLTIGEGEEIFFRVAENVSYLEKPKNKDFQVMNIFVPEPYFKNEKIGDFSQENAPILLINNSEQFLAQKPDEGKNPLILMALKKGFVVASVGVRGRNLKGEDNKFSGKAPSAIVDLKAAVQFLHHFDENLVGDSKKIIAYGSGSGAGEVLVLATSAQNSDFSIYLEELEAWGEDNSILASATYSPITNLEHLDGAYEWQFGGKNIPPKSLDDVKLAASEELRAQFAEYLESLNLKDEQESKLEVKPDGSGSFRDYLQNLIMEALKNQNLEEIKWISLKDGKVVAMDWDGFIKDSKRVMQVPYFDSFELNSLYNEVFGTSSIDKKHFTEISQAQDSADGVLAEERIIKMLNPMNYSSNPMGAKYFRIRQAVMDNSNCLAIPAILALDLKNADKSVDFALSWGEKKRISEEDLENFFSWVDKILNAEKENAKTEKIEQIPSDEEQGNKAEEKTQPSEVKEKTAEPEKAKN